MSTHNANNSTEITALLHMAQVISSDREVDVNIVNVVGEQGHYPFHAQIFKDG